MAAPSSPSTTQSEISSTSSGCADIKITPPLLSSQCASSFSSCASFSSCSSIFGTHPWSRQSSVDEGVFHSINESPARSIPTSPIGPKFKLVHEGDIQCCRLNHQRTVISKILSSKFLRRWETHRFILTSFNITSKTVSQNIIQL